MHEPINISVASIYISSFCHGHGKPDLLTCNPEHVPVRSSSKLRHLACKFMLVPALYGYACASNRRSCRIPAVAWSWWSIYVGMTMMLCCCSHADTKAVAWIEYGLWSKDELYDMPAAFICSQHRSPISRPAIYRAKAWSCARYFAKELKSQQQPYRCPSIDP